MYINKYKLNPKTNEKDKKQNYITKTLTKIKVKTENRKLK